jgi:hypothetical protein
MNVSLVSYSRDVEDRSLLNQIAYAVPFDQVNQNNEETAEKLVRYLIKHQHCFY